eukprot:357359-Chlamydomonas_euryale.AAC.1
MHNTWMQLWCTHRGCDSAVVLKNTAVAVDIAWAAQLGCSRCLAAEAVQRTALALERVDDIEGGHGLAARVLRVGDRVADDVLQEDLEHAARLLVDEAADALDATAASQAADRGLGNTLDVVAKHLAVALGAALAEALAALATSGHVDCTRRAAFLSAACCSTPCTWSCRSGCRRGGGGGPVE